MNGLTLSDLGWDITNYLEMDEQTEPERPDTEMLTCGGDHVTILKENQKWIKSDTVVEIKK